MKEGKFMTTYKIYYKEKGANKHGIWASQGTWYVEIPDSYGRRSAAEARAEFYRVHGTEKYEIVRTVKDC